MLTYVVLATFTDQGVKNAKNSPKRAEAFKQMAKTFGVTVKDIFWTQGRYDVVTVVESPDELSATALNLSLGALGNIRTESLRAFSSADMIRLSPRCSNRRQMKTCARLCLGRALWAINGPYGLSAWRPLYHRKRTYQWDTRGKKPNDPVERFRVPLFCN